MDPKLSTSFIPKQGLARAGQPYRPASGSVDLFLMIGVVLFLIVGALAGGLYLYNSKLNKDLTALDNEIKEKRAAFELGQIDEVKAFQRRVDAGSQVLAGHTALSQFFTLLEESTIPDVSFYTLRLSAGNEAGISVEMEGVAKGFSSIALQSDVFLSRPELIRHSFGKFRLVSNGFVEFSYTGMLALPAMQYGALLAEDAGGNGSTNP